MDTIAKETLLERDLIVIQQAHPPVHYTYHREEASGYLPFKRVFDVFLSAILILTVLSWLYPLLAILINISSRGGTLFIQKRVGLNGKEFSCLKFRTMFVNKEADKIAAQENDKRITRIGSWLRTTNIDELPQLINVLMGDMSIIGPRPHMLHHHDQFSAAIPYYNYRHHIKPGITGLSQILGYHGWIASRRDIISRTRLDLFYVKKISFGLDMYILFKTVTIFFAINKKRKNDPSDLR